MVGRTISAMPELTIRGPSFAARLMPGGGVNSDILEQGKGWRPQNSSMRREIQDGKRWKGEKKAIVGGHEEI